MTPEEYREHVVQKLTVIICYLAGITGMLLGRACAGGWR